MNQIPNLYTCLYCDGNKTECCKEFKPYFNNPNLCDYNVKVILDIARLKRGEKTLYFTNLEDKINRIAKELKK